MGSITISNQVLRRKDSTRINADFWWIFAEGNQKDGVPAGEQRELKPSGLNKNS